MARKTMAERYATQRSRRDTTRRRSLPRLSDSAVALQERADEMAQNDYDSDVEGVDGVRENGLAGGRSPRTATLARQTQNAAPLRRNATLDRIAGASSASTLPRVDYSYVVRDLRRIAVTAVAMLVLLIVLNLILQNAI